MEKIYIGNVTTVFFDVSLRGNEETSIKELKQHLADQLDRLNVLEYFESFSISFAGATFEKLFKFSVTLTFNNNLDYSAEQFKDIIRLCLNNFYTITDIRTRKEMKSIKDIEKEYKMMFKNEEFT